MKVSILVSLLSTVSLAVGEANLYLQQPLVQPFHPFQPLYQYYIRPAVMPSTIEPSSSQGNFLFGTFWYLWYLNCIIVKLLGLNLDNKRKRYI